MKCYIGGCFVTLYNKIRKKVLWPENFNFTLSKAYKQCTSAVLFYTQNSQTHIKFKHFLEKRYLQQECRTLGEDKRTSGWPCLTDALTTKPPHWFVNTQLNLLFISFTESTIIFLSVLFRKVLDGNYHKQANKKNVGFFHQRELQKTKQINPLSQVPHLQSRNMSQLQFEISQIKMINDFFKS